MKSFSRLRSWALLCLLSLVLMAGCGDSGSMPSLAYGDMPDPPQVPGVTPGGQATILSPAQHPTQPTSVPPKVAKYEAASKDLQARQETVEIKVQKGWSVFSLPFAQLSSIKGLTHQLTYWQGTQYAHVDPTLNPQNIDTKISYWIYAEEPQRIMASGVLNEEQTFDIPLQAGWNFIGLPYHENVPCQRISISRQGSNLRGLAQASSKDMTQDDSWVYSYVYVQSQGRTPKMVDISNSSAQLEMGGTHWIFAWNEAVLHLSPETTPPQLNTVTPVSAWEIGDRIQITGKNLGDPQQDQLLLSVAGIAVDSAAITSWTPTRISFTVPQGLKSGALAVFKNYCPSNTLSVRLSPNALEDARLGSLYGYVTDYQNNPLSNTQILLDSGHSAVSDIHGEFSIDSLPVGDYICWISRIGYKSVMAEITVKPGSEATTVRVQLREAGSQSTGGDSALVESKLTVRANKRTSGGQDYWPSSIRIEEVGDYSNRASDSWDSEDSYREVSITATVGSSYNVYIVWENDSGQELRSSHSVKVTQKNGQLVSYDN